MEKDPWRTLDDGFYIDLDPIFPYFLLCTVGAPLLWHWKKKQ
jgi:hypothetical protein